MVCLKLDSGDIELVYDWFKINILIMKLLFSYLFDCLLFAIVYRSIVLMIRCLKVFGFTLNRYNHINPSDKWIKILFLQKGLFFHI